MNIWIAGMLAWILSISNTGAYAPAPPVQEFNPDIQYTITADTPYITFRIQAANQSDFPPQAEIKEWLYNRVVGCGYTHFSIQFQGQDQVTVAFPESTEDLHNVADLITTPVTLTFTDYEGTILLNNTDIAQVESVYGPITDAGPEEYYLQLQFTADGARKFQEATARIATLPHPDNYIAITINETPISAPIVLSEIYSDTCIITGSFDKTSIQQFASQLKSATAPVSLELVTINMPKISG